MGRFTNFGTRFAQAARNFNIKNGYVTKGLKLGASILALRSVCGLLGDAHCTYVINSSKFNENNIVGHKSLLLNGEEQKYLYEKIQHLYSSSKPLYFGAVELNSRCYSTHEANYLFIEDRFRHNYKRKSESMAEFEKRRDEREAIGVRYFVENNMQSIKHELGHIVLEHQAKTSSFSNTTAIALAGLGVIGNTYGLKKAFLKSSSKLGILKPLCLIAAIQPVAGILRKGVIQANSRKHEREADDFAIRNADTIKELQQKMELQQDLHTAEKEIKAAHSYPQLIYEMYVGELSSHPSSLERVQTYARAIEQRKEQEKTS